MVAYYTYAHYLFPENIFHMVEIKSKDILLDFFGKNHNWYSYKNK